MFAEAGFLGLPTHFGADLLATLFFGTLLILLVAGGCKICDWAWKLKLEEQVAKGNLAAGVVMGALIFGLCYAVATVVTGILG